MVSLCLLFAGYSPVITDISFMTSRRSQLKQQITRTQDPVIRMQLEQLLNKKGIRHYKGIRKIEEPIDSVLRQMINRLPASTLRVLILILATIILFIIFIMLESGA